MKRLLSSYLLWLAFVPAFAQPNILFVGNSFTYSATASSYNTANVHDENGTSQGGVPGIFQKMTSGLGYSANISIEAVGGQTLAYHLANKSAIIGQSKWDIVILQGFSTEPTTIGDVAGFNNSLAQLKSLILGANPNAKIYLYETWARADLCSLGGSSNFPSLAAMLNQLHANYYAANAAFGFQGVAPVGDAFALAISSGYAMPNPYTPVSGKWDLWWTDNYHASTLGSYLSAAVFAAQIAGLDPRYIPTGAGSAAAGLSISAADAANLNLVAYQITATAPAITSPSATIFGAGVTSNFKFTATGIPAPTFSATGLPAWASLDPVSGTISGTPPSGTTSSSTILITASNGVSSATTQSFTLDVNAPAIPVILNGPPPTTAPIRIAPYNFAFQASGAPTPTFSLTSGSLPSGMALSSSGTLFGTPTAAGTYWATVSAGNGYGSASQTFSIVAQAVAPTITNGPPPATALIGNSYTFTLLAGGAPAPTFSVTSGKLPPGINLSSTGVFSGSPTTAGTYFATVSAANGFGAAAIQSFSIGVQPGTVEMFNFGVAGSGNWNSLASNGYTNGSVTNAKDFRTGAATGVKLQITTPFTFSTTYGTASTALYPGSIQNYAYAVGNTDAAGVITLSGLSTSSTYNITVFGSVNNGWGGLVNYTIGTTTLNLATTNNTTLTTTFPKVAPDANGKIVLSVSAGTESIGDINVLTVSAPGQPSTISNGPATITATVGTAYSFTYTAGGSPASGFSVTSGALPPGLTLTSAGTISGTPTAAGSYAGVIGAANGAGSASQNFAITVAGNYSQWTATRFTAAQQLDPTISGLNVAPQHDGVTNLIKYLCDINPSSAMSAADRGALPVAGTSGSYLTLTYRRNPALMNLTVEVQVSTDLQNWQTVAPDLNQNAGTDTATGDPLIRVGVDATLGKKFIRLRLTSI